MTEKFDASVIAAGNQMLHMRFRRLNTCVFDGKQELDIRSMDMSSFRSSIVLSGLVICAGGSDVSQVTLWREPTAHWVSDVG